MPPSLLACYMKRIGRFDELSVQHHSRLVLLLFAAAAVAGRIVADIQEDGCVSIVPQYGAQLVSEDVAPLYGSQKKRADAWQGAVRAFIR